MDIPDSWEALVPKSNPGLLMVIGGPDLGKTFFSRYLYRRVSENCSRAAFLDGDPGQGVLGPPGTMTMTFNPSLDDDLVPDSQSSRFFVGAVSPVGHMLQVLTGAGRLTQLARAGGAGAIVYDTCGLIAPEKGGHNLKRSKIDLLTPGAVFVLQRERELEALISPYRRSRRLRVIDVRISPEIRRRETLERQSHRSEWYRRYFTGASSLIVNCRKYAVIPSRFFTVHQLVSLEKADGLTLGLGLVEEIDPSAGQVMLLTPRPDLKGVDALRLGSILVDPGTFADTRILRN